MFLFGPPNIAKLEEKHDSRTLIKALEYKDPLIRRQAAAALGRLQDPTTEPALVTALQDEDPSVRAEAALSLGSISSLPAVEQELQTVLANEDISVRCAGASALQALGWQPSATPAGAMFCICTGDWSGCQKIGAPAFEPLLFILTRAEPEQRLNSAILLAQFKERRAAPALIQELSHATGAYREALVKALGTTGDPAGIPFYVDILKDKAISESLRWAAENALTGSSGEEAILPLIEALKDADSWVHTAAGDALSRMGKVVIPALLTEFNAGARGQVSELLLELAERYRDPGPKSRVIETLIMELSLGGDVARTAALQLGRLGDARALDPMLDLLKNKNIDPETARYASEAVGRIAHLPTLERLLDRIHFGDYEERYQAGLELAKYYHTEQLTPLASRIILAHREILSRPHVDQVVTRDEHRMHEDTGIGVEL